MLADASVQKYTKASRASSTLSGDAVVAVVSASTDCRYANMRFCSGRLSRYLAATCAGRSEHRT